MEGLSREEVAALKQLAKSGPLLVAEAERAHARRTAPRGFNGNVKKTGMTADEAALSGARRSVASAMRSHEKSLERMAEAERELERTAGDVEYTRACLADLEA